MGLADTTGTPAAVGPSLALFLAENLSPMSCVNRVTRSTADLVCQKPASSYGSSRSMIVSTITWMSLEDFKEDTQQRYRTIALWVPQWLLWLRDRNYKCSSPDLWNFELARAGIEEVAEPRLESRPSVEYKLGVQSRRFSWLQASEGSSKLFRPEGFGHTVTLRCWNLPKVGLLLVDEPGGLSVAIIVCPILHQLRGDGICRDGAKAGGAS